MDSPQPVWQADDVEAIPQAPAPVRERRQRGAGPFLPWRLSQGVHSAGAKVNTASGEFRLRGFDYLLLLLVCGVLYGSSLINPRILTSHETTHCLNVREMMASGDWLIPTYGGRPWLERPPVPHWLTAAGVTLLGDLGGAVPERSYRVASIFIATLAVLFFTWAIAGALGRTIGLMSGAILATMQEFAAYATGPETDIFLASTVTIAGSLLVRALFDSAARERNTSFLGWRSWPVVGFFALLGAMNAMKGPLFGMLFLAIPLGAYFIWGRRLSELRPLVWLWGWLLTLGLGLAWPVAAYLRYPDIVDLWAIDYGVRWNQGYLGEPPWYYFAQQPWNYFPWTLPVFLGLLGTAGMVCRREAPALRFLWCWALGPVLFFSLFKGKHHHYMLNCLAPAAVIAAYGARWFWVRAQSWPGWLRRPWLSLPSLGIPGAVAIGLLREKVPGPDWVIPAWMIFWIVACWTFWWIVGGRDGGVAFAGCCALAIVVQGTVYEYRTAFAEEYTDDLEFIHQVPAFVAPERPLFVLGEFDPLYPSWPLFHLNGQGRLLHNDTYLLDERITTPQALVVCRQRYLPFLQPYGTTELLAQSKRARYEHAADDRYSLYALTFYPDLPRVPANVRMTPLQATGRAVGPFLGRPASEADHDR